MSGCPSFSDLMWFAETGERPAWEAHPLSGCRNCQARLAEYLKIRAALRQLGPGMKVAPRDLAGPAAGRGAAPEPGPGHPARPDLQRIAPEAFDALAIAREARNYFLHDWAKARALAAEALERCGQLPDSPDPAARQLARIARAEAWSVAGVCDVFGDRPEEGEIRLNRALQAWEELGDALGIGATRHHLAIACMNRKALADAEFHARQALEELLGIGQDGEAVKARNTLAIILANQGRHAEARAQYLEVLPELERLKKPGEWAMAAVSQARTEQALGDPGEALRLARAAEPLLLEAGFSREAARCGWLLGLLQFGQPGRADAALKKMLAARDALLGQGMWVEPAIINCDAALALLKAGRRADAHALLRSIREILPADLANRWVDEAVASLEREFAAGTDQSLLRAWEHLATQLHRDEPPPPAADDPRVH